MRVHTGVRGASSPSTLTFFPVCTLAGRSQPPGKCDFLLDLPPQLFSLPLPAALVEVEGNDDWAESPTGFVTQQGFYSLGFSFLICTVTGAA